jgi:hypothetical protein
MSFHGYVIPWLCHSMVMSFHGYVIPWLCHSMVMSFHGQSLRAAEDAVEFKDDTAILNSLLIIVTQLSYRFALAASHPILTGECRYPEMSSFVF